MSAHIRTFISVHFSHEVISNLDRISRELKTSLSSQSKVKWIRPENIHLTLQFLGDVGSGEIEELSFCLSGAFRDMVAFEVVLSGVGCFPSILKPRVFWVGIQSGKEALKNLYSRVVQITTPLGFTPEDRAFEPHVTLGRVKIFREPKKLLAFFDRNANTHAGSCQIDAIHLMASKLTPTGAVYTILDSFRFEA